MLTTRLFKDQFVTHMSSDLVWRLVREQDIVKPLMTFVAMRDFPARWAGISPENTPVGK